MTISTPGSSLPRLALNSASGRIACSNGRGSKFALSAVSSTVPVPRRSLFGADGYRYKMARAGMRFR